LLSTNSKRQFARSIFESISTQRLVIELTRKQRISLAALAVCSFGAATAFSIAPASMGVDAPNQTAIVESVALESTVIGASDHGIFHRQERIQRGDTLSLILQRLGAQDPAFLAFARKDRAARQLLQLRPGRTVAAELDGSGHIRRFWALVDGTDGAKGADGANELGGEAKLSSARRVLITRTASSEQDKPTFVARDEGVQIERTLEMRGFEIRSSLFSATDEAGIPDAVATQVAEILGGDLDFHRDLRRGDSVRVTWESLRVADGLDSPVVGRVLAVEMVHQNRKIQAVWFDRGNGRGDYYNAQGRSIRKAFLRSPLEYSRVSSGFSESRLHPIHHDWRAHRGVDYAAPSGTRVRAVADGVVDAVGRKGGYGNVLSIKHSNKTVSLYAHLSGFGPGLRPGSRISQGDLVGFVGSTGWATGPHLHYEFLVDGTNVDPLKVALPTTAAVSSVEQAQFRSQVDKHMRRIALLSAPRLARFE
jgi:murein DD-endopeptidase MepM/ murein hydrolase activator NlpD